jgi:molybdopterin/thiamine biosynthesis adenylyltransferase
MEDDNLMKKLDEFLKANALGDLLPWKAHRLAMREFNISCRQVEQAALTLNILPARYQRNRKTITTLHQLKLFQSKVAVIGCGGLGGYIIEELARLGVGMIKAIDPDVFEEHNLNRQILCKVSDIGKPKATVAKTRVQAVNPAVKIISVVKPFSNESGVELLEAMDVVVDALDSVPTRIELAECCEKLNIPMVHGTIGGWYGQVTTQLPGDNTVQMIYKSCKEAKGVERVLGNPSFTPAVVASLEVAEVCKILLGQGTALRKRMLFINLLDMEIDQVEIGEAAKW